MGGKQQVIEIEELVSEEGRRGKACRRHLLVKRRAAHGWRNV